jgi:hypothetical protein
VRKRKLLSHHSRYDTEINSECSWCHGLEKWWLIEVNERLYLELVAMVIFSPVLYAVLGIKMTETNENEYCLEGYKGEKMQGDNKLCQLHIETASLFSNLLQSSLSFRDLHYKIT